jgi:hypothetical protein
MNPLFRTLSYYQDVPRASFDDEDTFEAAVPSPGTWPAPHGGAGRTGRSAEPLVHDSFGPRWKAPLRGAENPDDLLVGAGRILVSGAERGLWDMDGRPCGEMQRQGRLGTLLDPRGQRLLTHDDGDGLGVFTLDGRRESTLRASAPSEGVTREILQGPGVLVFVSSVGMPHGGGSAFVEALRVRDYGNVKNGVLYGIEPLGGLTRETDEQVEAAAAKDGPVLVTPDGVDWRDWQLQPLRQVEISLSPRAVSVDDRGTVFVISGSGALAELHVFSPEGAHFQLPLSAETGPFITPPLVAPSGQIYLVSPGAILALAPDGRILWKLPRANPAPSATAPLPVALSGNGLLLVGGETLDAVTDEGRTLNLWWPPSPILTPPVLVNEHIYVATSEELFSLHAV